jgi:hypothetical protein
MPSKLHFPRPAFRLDSGAAQPPSEAIASYLAQVNSWRLNVLEFLQEPAATESASEWRALAWPMALFLASDWTAEMSEDWAQSVPKVVPFPASALQASAHPKIDTVREVLCWRAILRDYLEDFSFSDAIHLRSDQELAERLDQCLHPQEHKEICALCLTELGPGQRSAAVHDCTILRLLPATPRIWSRNELRP